MLLPDASDGPVARFATPPTDPPEPPEPAERSEPPTPAESAPGAPPSTPRRPGPGAIWLVAVAIVVVLGGSGLFAAGFALGSQTSNQPGTPADAAADFQPFWDTYAAISEHFAGEPVSRQTLVQGAIKGMLGALDDPFSFYLSPADFTNSLQGLNGQFQGIGATIDSQAPDGTEGCTPLGPQCLLVVVKPVPGAPADKAGLEAGDRITAVDGKSVDGQTVDATLATVRGPKGTVVTLTIVRGSAAPRDLAITRDIVVQPEVVAKDLAAGQVGYIGLSGFSDNATAQLVNALTTDVQAGKKKIVLDLRGNGGGFVTSARTIASQFIASGPIFWEQGANTPPIATPATGDGVALDPAIKLVVLVDRNSASASEIVAGALQDTKRGELIGQQTYGKGTIQQFLPLDQDMGGFRLTIARWLTPDQRWINKTGLTPDVVVPVPAPGSVPAGDDPVLDKALEVLGVAGATGSVLPVAA
ncbi:MAG: S41 family peptidase [Candidatus Limnocylindrales bacterium]